MPVFVTLEQHWRKYAINYVFFSILSKYITVSITHIRCVKPYDISLSEMSVCPKISEEKKILLGLIASLG